VTRDEYIRSVGFRLRDLPWSTRRDLTAELRGHLDELPPDTDLTERLGPPEEYADELRAAAGLERRRGLIAFLRARRPRNLILTVVALTLIGLAIGSIVWVDSYQPLSVGNSYRFPDGSVEAPAGGSSSVVFHQGRPFQLALEVQNAGRFTVRVLGVPYPSGLPFKARLLMYQPTRHGGDASPLKAFHAFDLKPGWRDVLLLRGVYANCSHWPGSGATGLTAFPVRYKFMWRTATASIPLPEELAIVFRHNDNCAARP
jgi:hypothetical protein